MWDIAGSGGDLGFAVNTNSGSLPRSPPRRSLCSYTVTPLFLGSLGVEGRRQQCLAQGMCAPSGKTPLPALALGNPPCPRWNRRKMTTEVDEAWAFARGP